MKAKMFLNFEAKPLTIRHSELERHGDSAYRSICPACKKGVLLVNRNRRTFSLQRADHCTFCAQCVIYTDDLIVGEAPEPLANGYLESLVNLTNPFKALQD